MKLCLKNLSVLVSVGHIFNLAQAYVSPEIRQGWKEGYSINKAVATIEECVNLGDKMDKKKNEELFGAVKFVDRFAHLHYPDEASKQALLERANGSWGLRLALNSDKDQEFYPHPEFRTWAMAFITVDEEYFGKGIGPDSNFCLVALGGPSTRRVETRQIYMNYEDFYINGRTVPGWDLSYFMRGYERNWVAAERKRPKLAFTVICATDECMAVRGNKTGGIAMFRRIKDDMRPCAYGS